MNRSTRKALWFLPDWGSYRPHLSNGLKRTQSLPAADSVQAGGYTNVCKRLAIKALIEQCAALHPAMESRCSGAASEACVPMVFTAAEACRFAWSDVFVMADARESLEMALDTHGQAFTFFGGAPARMMEDPRKTVVDTICAGRQRRFNRRFVSCESRHRKRFLPLQSSKKSSLQSNGLQLCKLENFGR